MTHIDTDGRHPATQQIARWFAWWHLTSQDAARTEQMRDHYAATTCRSSECDC